MRLNASVKIFLTIFLFPYFSYAQSDYFPIEIGNSWTYHEYGIDWYDYTRTISDTITIDGNLCYYYRWTTLDTSEIIFPDSLGRIWKYIKGEMQLWFDFTMAETDSYFYKDENGIFNYVVTIYRNGRLIIWPDFVDTDSCIAFAFDDPHFVDEERYYYFAPSIGLIERVTGMGIHFLLKSAIIDGKLISKVENTHEIIPSRSALMQNYPNPFNPSTKIKFALPKPETVIIEVYSVIGQKIKTLLDNSMPAGYHEVDFNGENLSSGIYLYRIEAGEWTDVKKMLLLK